MKKYFLLFFVYFLISIQISLGKEITEKPFILEHLYHVHKIDLTNTTVFQQISNYGAFYNITNVFFDYQFTKNDHLFISGAVAFGNGVVNHMYNLGYSVEPTGANLEDYVENINDTGRKHLLEFWYHRTFGKFDFVTGLMDSASFVDENEYANDENIQFLNNAFVNNPVVPLPSFNPGIYLRYKTENVDYKLLFIENEPEDGNVLLLQLNVKKENLNLRPYLYRTFGLYEKQEGFGISADFSGKNYGYFLRVGIPINKQSSFYSFGLIKNISNNKLGFALGFLNKRKNLYLSELYYNIQITSHLLITLDIQFMKEEKSAFIQGVRVYMFY